MIQINIVREVREKQKMTILELARRTRISPTDLSQMERMRRPAFPSWRRRISRALNVSEAELFPFITETAQANEYE